VQTPHLDALQKQSVDLVSMQALSTDREAIPGTRLRPQATKF
jgi:hypothetical protein